MSMDHLPNLLQSLEEGCLGRCGSKHCAKPRNTHQQLELCCFVVGPVRSGLQEQKFLGSQRGEALPCSVEGAVEGEAFWSGWSVT